MHKFETMDNMNTNFVTLSDQELMEMDGDQLQEHFFSHTAYIKVTQQRVN